MLVPNPEGEGHHGNMDPPGFWIGSLEAVLSRMEEELTVLGHY